MQFELVMPSGEHHPGAYSGQLINGLPHGDGSWTSADGTRAYQGQWERGRRHGYGVFRSLGEEFTGGFRMNLEHGTGQLKRAGEKTVVGVWEDGVLGEHAVLFETVLVNDIDQTDRSKLMEQAENGNV